VVPTIRNLVGQAVHALATALQRLAEMEALVAVHLTHYLALQILVPAVEAVDSVLRVTIKLIRAVVVQVVPGWWQCATSRL
jgi:hypothetical protein